MAKQNNKTLRGSTAAKIIIFFLLVISFLVTVILGFLSVWIVNEDMYTKSLEKVISEVLENKAYDDYYIMGAYKIGGMENTDIQENAVILQKYCEGTNLRIEVYGAGTYVWGNYDGFETPYSYTYYPLSGWGVTQPRVVLYIDPSFSENDDYRVAYDWSYGLYTNRYVIPIIAGVSLLLFFICFVFLMCASGHKNGKEGITSSVLSWAPLDVYTVVYGWGTLFIILVLSNVNGDFWVTLVYVLLFGSLFVIGSTIYAMEVSLRFKKGKWWRHTLIYVSLRFAKRILWKVVKGIVYLLKSIPMVPMVVLAYLGLWFLEFCGLVFFGGEEEMVIVHAVEKVILFFPVLYIALMCKKLQQGSNALAEGDLAYQVDTSKMVLAFKEHGNNLNRIAEGMGVAVEQRMKSERLKTELITNVSHDIKTPLTSIINYSDLIGVVVKGSCENENGEKISSGDGMVADDTQKETLLEYADVLNRQSKRMKKLLDDLVEASKATTGTIEVKLEPCQVDVLLSQAVGEYEKPFLEKNLQLVTRWPEESVKILADGRHLWRVFDNLMGNICKYAQENSRVYLTLEVKKGNAEIIFRNMSKYALDVSGEELKERFVRGDKSRHMEGSGLGLSIAGSLIELQNGTLEIVTDGDLFKVVITFKVL